ncbi:RNA polymerase sigma factor SigJ [Actinoplanes sp. CA-252034]|uniref:RNA polymerase sigma factor SigJ n=1 Tax=Actinoplanes sp. CA-252034 TaxID=3239906 RepID=UPI003D958D47
MVVSSRDVEVFEQARPRLEAIAYRMLGSAGDAEDAVQDTFLRWQAADRELVEIPEAWLTRVLTNLCLNQLTSARARREAYVGQWLPEPLLDGDRMLGPAETAEQRDSVSIAVLTLMERLTPNERAVYVLREAFGYPHAEIAGFLDLTEPNCQQIHRRARQHMADGRARTETDVASARRIAEQFLAAALSGEVEPLVRMLTGDAVGVADGGGEVPARTTPIVGGLQLARLLRGILRPGAIDRFLPSSDLSLHAAVVNGGPALVAVAGDQVVGVICIEVTADGIAALNIQGSPSKLHRITREWATAQSR